MAYLLVAPSPLTAACACARPDGSRSVTRAPGAIQLAGHAAKGQQPAHRGATLRRDAGMVAYSAAGLSRTARMVVGRLGARARGLPPRPAVRPTVARVRARRRALGSGATGT